jgi:hypothetical protein
VDYINEQLQENDRAKISAGLVVKAMILKGLGFREHQKKDDPMIIAVWQRFPQTIF